MISVLTSIRRRWSQPGGYRELFRVAVPLVLGAASISIQAFVDKLFLTWYSPRALAAVLPAEMLFATLSCFVGGVAGYATTFVAQYSGAGRNDRVGPSVWQGIYLSLVGALLVLCLAPFANTIFDWFRHDAAVRPLEASYFRIMCLGSFTMVHAGVVGFFNGRGDTRPVMWITFGSVLVNVLLDYAWIFGRWGFPEWGIEGAAWATVLAQMAGLAVYLGLLMRPEARRRYRTLSGWRPDLNLLRRMVRYGLPVGLESLAGVLSMTLYVLIVGRLGQTALASTNLVFNVAWVAFVPIMGVGQAVAILAGKYLGKDDDGLAARTTWSAFHVAMVLGTGLVVIFVAFPGLVLAPFASGADAAAFAPVREMAVVLIRIMAVSFLFDLFGVIFGGALRGAGDTRYVMWMMLALSWGISVVPVYVACTFLGRGVYTAWCLHAAFIVVLGTAFLRRFLKGKWRSMRVIERATPMMPVEELGE